MKEKILVLGTGPSLPEQLKNKDLSEFKVVRVNPWKEIEGCDNKCDAWAFYPHHHIGEPLSLYDVMPYIKKTKEIWMPHYGFGHECERITGKFPDYLITEQQTKDFHLLIGNPNPTSGAVVIYMATLLDADIYIAGFDFYEGENNYYWPNENQKKSIGSEHNPCIEKAWIKEQIKNNNIKLLKRS